MTPAVISSSNLPTLPVEKILEHAKDMKRLVKECMKEKTDYGKIPGVPKMFLWKSGAQTICMNLRLKPEYELVDTIQLPNFHKEYIVKCRLVHTPTGEIVSEGLGSCSTMESKYRWRKPKATFKQIKELPNSYWGINNKKKKAAPSEVPALLNQMQGILGGDNRGIKKVNNEWWVVQYEDNQDPKPIENPDIADQWNTVLKQAEKRAYVGATLTVSAASGLFSQDFTEPDDLKTAAQQNEPPADNEPPQQMKRPPEYDPADESTRIHPDAAKALKIKCGQEKIDVNEMLKKFGAGSIDDLTGEQHQAFLKELEK